MMMNEEKTEKKLYEECASLLKIQKLFHIFLYHPFVHWRKTSKRGEKKVFAFILRRQKEGKRRNGKDKKKPEKKSCLDLLAPFSGVLHLSPRWISSSSAWLFKIFLKCFYLRLNESLPCFFWVIHKIEIYFCNWTLDVQAVVAGWKQILSWKIIIIILEQEKLLTLSPLSEPITWTHVMSRQDKRMKKNSLEKQKNTQSLHTTL